MERKQVVDQTKKIQSQLKRHEITLSLQQVRDAIAQHLGEYDSEMNLTDEMCLEVIEHVRRSSPAPLAKSNPQDKSALSATNVSNLSVKEKDKIINSVAREIDVSLPVEALRDIAQSVDWAIGSRLELMQELRSQIKLWAEHQLLEVQKVSEDIREQTEQLFAEVSSTIHDAIESDNAEFTNRAQAMKSQVADSIEKFRDSRDSILAIFAVPS